MLLGLNRILVFEPFFYHTTPIYTTIEIPLVRWHFDDFDEIRNTEANLRKGLKKLPHWIRNFEWSYIQYESQDYCLVAEHTGIEFETKYSEKADLKFKIVVAEWFGEKRDDTRLIPNNQEDLRLPMEENYWVKKRQ